GGFPQLMRMTRDGKRLFVSMNAAGKVVMFDTSNPSAPRVLKVLDLGGASGPHYIALTEDEKRLVITDYFLNEDDFGKVHAEGDRAVFEIEHIQTGERKRVASFAELEGLMLAALPPASQSPQLTSRAHTDVSGGESSNS